MVDSPSAVGNNVVRVSVTAGAMALTEGTQLLAVHVAKRVNGISRARVVLVDGDLNAQSFPLSDGDTFAPGAQIEIKAGYGSDEDTLFKGVVISHALRISGNNETRLVLECRDDAIKLTDVRRNATFTDKTDSQIIEAILADQGLTGEVDRTGETYGELLQHYCTDWDFLLSRAEVNGLIVTTDDGTVCVKAPQVGERPVLRVTYGEDLMEFDAELDARYQRAGAEGIAWDPASQAIVQGAGVAPTSNAQGNLTGAQLSNVMGQTPYRLQTPANYSERAMADWASAQRTRTALARLRGRLKFQGNAKAKAGVIIECAGVGTRFEGDAFIAGVEHTIENGEWFTEVEMGLAPEWFAERVDIQAPSAAGLLPGVEGLQIGIVKQLHEDPSSEFRVKVQLPVLQTGDEGVWARLGSFHASNAFGALFVPELDDEVVVGFLNGDIGHPIILGSLYSSAAHPTAYELTQDNFIKAIVTREKMKLEFDEQKKVITLITPAQNQVVIDDENKSITLSDQTGNTVTLAPEGIALDSPKDISLKAKGNVAIDAGAAVSITAASDLTAKGLNVTASAEASLTASGSASAELSASGQTTVKGAMVMIN